MKLKVDQFCTLATSASWQSWLYHTDVQVFQDFINRLQNSRGCTQNREIMKDALGALIDKGYSEGIYKYISANYPYMVDSEIVKGSRKNHLGPVFEFRPNVITYPRRAIFEGNVPELKRKINSFTLDKYRHDSIIVGNVGYVEYLTREDKDIEPQIPIKNWLIAAYRIKAAE